MRAVALDTVTLGAWVLDLGGLDRLRLLVVTRHADGLRVTLRQHDFAVLGGLVADVAALVAEGRMHVLLHQLRSGRFVRIVASRADRPCKRLALVSLRQFLVFYIMASDAQLRRGLRQMEIELLLTLLPHLVRDMAGFAAHVEGRMPAAFLGSIHALTMATETQILGLIAGRRFQQQVLIRRGMRIVTLQAVLDCWAVDLAGMLLGLLVSMALEAERRHSSVLQVHSRRVSSIADNVASQAAHVHGRVDMLAFAPVFVTLDALGRVRALFKLDRMDCRR